MKTDRNRFALGLIKSAVPKVALAAWFVLALALMRDHAAIEGTISATFDNAYTDTTGANGFCSGTTPPPTLPTTTPLSGQERHCSGADAC